MPVAWRLVIDGDRRGSLNMAIDEAMLLCHAAGKSPPTLRLYGWHPPALSLGYAQRVEEVVDFEACQRLGIDVVRRPTGGRAVLHDDEVTYSVVVSTKLVPGTVEETYLVFSRVIVEALRRLGVPAGIAPRASRGIAPSGRSPLCFESPASFEIVADGKKLVGSAQVRQHGCILQHGSIVVSLNLEKLSAVTRGGAGRLKGKATSICEVTGRAISRAEIIQNMVQAFRDHVGDLTEGELTREELELAFELEQKYKQLCWRRI